MRILYSAYKVSEGSTERSRLLAVCEEIRLRFETGHVADHFSLVSLLFLFLVSIREIFQRDLYVQLIDYMRTRR